MRAPKQGIPPAVDHLCKKALAREPAGRWQSAQKLGEAIEDIYRETVGDATGPRAPSASSSARGYTGGSLVFSAHDLGSEVRLRRSDIDAYEASIKRRRVLVWLAMVLFTLGAVGAVGWYLLRPPGVVAAEREPNDDPSTANRIRASVKGFLGKRVSQTEGDKDHYRVDGSGRRVVSIVVSGVPNIDLSLSIDDSSGHATSSDEGKVGEGEALHRRLVDGVVIVTIAQTMAKDQKLPVENVSDPYEVTVIEERADAGEVEPNNMEADATPIIPTYELKGYLDSKTDIDLLRWTGETGTYIVVVRADNVPLQWKTSDGKPRTPGEVTIELKKGELVRIERTPNATHGSRDAPWSIVVVGSGRAK
jgi:hypothetical protein